MARYKPTVKLAELQGTKMWTPRTIDGHSDQGSADATDVSVCAPSSQRVGGTSLLPTQNGWPPALPMTRDNELPEQTEPEEKTGCGCCRHSKSPDLRLANERTRPPHPHVLNSTFGAAEQRAYDMCDKLTHPRELG